MPRAWRTRGRPLALLQLVALALALACAAVPTVSGEASPPAHDALHTHVDQAQAHVQTQAQLQLSQPQLQSRSPTQPHSRAQTTERPTKVVIIDVHRSLTYRRPAVLSTPASTTDTDVVRRTVSTPAEDPDDVVTFWPNFFAKLMSTFYAALCLLSFVQLMRTIIHKHKIKSFRFGFLLVCFLWTLLRVIFWFWVELNSWPTWLSDLIYFLPNACQITTFSLLILFYAKLVHGHRWRLLRVRFLGFCILSNIAMVLLTVTFSVLLDRVAQTEEDDPTSEAAQNVKEFVSKLYFICSAVFFGVLVLLASFYLYQIQKSRSGTAGTSKQEVLVTTVIFLIFLSRCIWDLLAAFDSGSTLFRHSIWETTTTHVKLMNLATFILLFVWEIIPTVMVLFYFRNVPHTADSYCVGIWSCCQTRPCLRGCLSSWPFYFPPDYFEPSENSDNTNTPAHATPEESRSQLDAPEYSRMEEDPAGASSNPLPPGSFVRSSSNAHYVSTGSLYGRSFPTASGALGMQIGTQIGMQIGSHKGVPVGSLAGGVHLGPGGHTDLYGSPTWLNPSHPALSHLMPTSSPHHPANQHPYNNNAHPQASHAYSREDYVDETQEEEEDYAAHPYVHAQIESTRMIGAQPVPSDAPMAATSQGSRYQYIASSRRAEQ